VRVGPLSLMKADDLSTTDRQPSGLLGTGVPLTVSISFLGRFRSWRKEEGKGQSRRGSGAGLVGPQVCKKLYMSCRQQSIAP
jgi:hypothetical protein